MTYDHKYLKKLEFRFKFFHGRSTLIGEHPLSREEFDELTQAINTYIGNSPERIRFLCERYPGSVSVFLVHCSLFGYTRRTANFWDSVWAQLNVKRTSSLQQFLGATFNEYVKRAKMATFSSASRVFVDPILLHTPIPLECLHDFFRDVTYTLVEEPDISFTEIVDMGDLITPIKSFLTHGDQVAEGFVNRTVELYRRLATFDQSTARSEEVLEELAGECGLPLHVVQSMVAWFPKRDETVASRTRRRLTVRFDPYGHGVSLEIPPYQLPAERKARSSVTVEADANPVDVPLNVDWFAVTAKREPISLAAPMPAKRYAVAIPDTPLTYACRGIDPDQPTFFNPKTGRPLATGPLPLGEVWVLAPQGWKVHGDRVGQSGHDLVTEHFPPMHGAWRGLQALCLNTRHYTTIRWLDRDDAPLPDYDRPVTAHEETKPQLISGRRLVYDLTTPDAPGVFTHQVPKLWLPINPDNEDPWSRWSITCSRASGEKVFHKPLKELEAHLIAEDDGVCLDLASPSLLGEAFGNFELAIHGPLGQDDRVSLVLLRDVDFIFPEPPGDQANPDITLFHIRKGAHKFYLMSEDAEISPARGGYVVSVRPNTRELTLRFVSEAESDQVATLTMRTHALDWRTLDSEDPDLFHEWQPAGDTPDHRAIRSIDQLATKSIALKTHFRKGCRHQLVLLADGKPVQRIKGRRNQSVPQRSRFDLSQLTDTVRSHPGSDFELRAQIDWPGGSYRVPILTFEMEWRIKDLEAFLLKSDNGITTSPETSYLLSATWSEVCQPASSRVLILKDVWRGGTAYEIAIPGSAVGVYEPIAADQLPPGQYEVGFSTRQGWSRRGRQPREIKPATIIDFKQSEWKALLSNPQTPGEWLMVAHAFSRGALRRLPDIMPAEAWGRDDLARLGDCIVSTQSTHAKHQLLKTIERWTLTERWRIVQATAEKRSGDAWHDHLYLRKLTVALGLMRYLNYDVRHETGGVRLPWWPTLDAVIHRTYDTAQPAALNDHEIRSMWGYHYCLRDPSQTSVTNLTDRDFDAFKPSLILQEWIQIRNLKSAFLHHGDAIERAYHDLRDVLPKVVRVVVSKKMRHHTRFRRIYDCLSFTFEMTTSHRQPAWTTQLAFVYAATALLQRAAAYEMSLQGLFNDRKEMEELFAVCPDLYDYYLLLTEAVLTEPI